MSRAQSRAQRREAFLRRAAETFDELEEWYDEHEEASFGEIEQEARRVRRGLMGEALGLLVNGRHAKPEAEAPCCSACGEEMKFVGYRPKTVSGLEGETSFERSYYVCPAGCGETVFPPG